MRRLHDRDLATGLYWVPLVALLVAYHLYSALTLHY
jgi:hypothetical protein